MIPILNFNLLTALGSIILNIPHKNRTWHIFWCIKDWKTWSYKCKGVSIFHFIDYIAIWFL